MFEQSNLFSHPITKLSTYILQYWVFTFAEFVGVAASARLLTFANTPKITIAMPASQSPIAPEVIAVQVVDSRALLGAMLDHYCKSMSAISGNSPEAIREEVFAIANEYKPLVVDMMLKDSNMGLNNR